MLNRIGYLVLGVKKIVLADSGAGCGGLASYFQVQTLECIHNNHVSGELVSPVRVVRVS